MTTFLKPRRLPFCSPVCACICASMPAEREVPAQSLMPHKAMRFGHVIHRYPVNRQVLLSSELISALTNFDLLWSWPPHAGQIMTVTRC